MEIRGYLVMIFGASMRTSESLATYKDIILVGFAPYYFLNNTAAELFGQI